MNSLHPTAQHHKFTWTLTLSRRTTQAAAILAAIEARPNTNSERSIVSPNSPLQEGCKYTRIMFPSQQTLFSLRRYQPVTSHSLTSPSEADRLRLTKVLPS